MKTVKINKTFESTKECWAWEKDNLDKIAEENGGVVLMVMHEEAMGNDSVILTEIFLA